ncbi:hypothetical protein SS50377_25819 [Spironucleus salmonicida]|uniref:Uncharacterized protein n=1 Tax=Spironucleus salmonicida TaxID=348837 RepID=V6LLJ8_9EUKA|nr:hypothetical protein SS50377_25819 [Spironucleus salmonicida]|eukprot:EST45422.1 Hypothetical protein SS50377_14654 [Spironucleus salmonicida]
MRKIRQLSLDNLDPPTNSSITIKQSRHYQMRPKSRGWDIPKLLKPYSVEVVKPRVTNMQKDFLKRSQTIEQENKLLIRSISASMSIDDMLRGYTPDVKLTQKEIQAAKAIIDKKQVKQWIK